MAEKNIPLEGFVRKVLTCVKEEKRTTEEIQECYINHYPQSLLEKALGLPRDIKKTESVLLWLVKEDFIHKEVTNFTDEALEKETEIFWISNKGRSYLLPKK